MKQCFDSIFELTYKNFEVIFIDNNSKDESVDFVKNTYPIVKIIQNKKDYGFAKANNIAASFAIGKYLALLNIDTKVDRNWLTELVKVAETSADIGIVVSKHYYYDDQTLINFAGGSCDKYGKCRHIGENLNVTKKITATDGFNTSGAGVYNANGTAGVTGAFNTADPDIAVTVTDGIITFIAKSH